MHGDLVDAGRSSLTYALLDPNDPQPRGMWVDTREAHALSLDVVLGERRGVLLRGTNRPKPQAEDDGHQLGELITSDGLVIVPAGVAWIRAVPLEGGSGPVTALLHVVQ